MNLDQAVFKTIGVITLLTALLAYYQDPHWVWVNAIFGVHLFQMSITGFCPVGMLLKKLGMKSGCVIE